MHTNRWSLDSFSRNIVTIWSRYKICLLPAHILTLLWSKSPLLTGILCKIYLRRVTSWCGWFSFLSFKSNISSNFSSDFKSWTLFFTFIYWWTVSSRAWFSLLFFFTWFILNSQTNWVAKTFISSKLLAFIGSWTWHKSSRIISFYTFTWSKTELRWFFKDWIFVLLISSRAWYIFNVSALLDGSSLTWSKFSWRSV